MKDEEIIEKVKEHFKLQYKSKEMFVFSRFNFEEGLREAIRLARQDSINIINKNFNMILDELGEK